MTAGRDQGTFIAQYGTNAERLALDAAQIKPLTAWYETDTALEYKWFGSWVAYPGAASGGGGSRNSSPNISSQTHNRPPGAYDNTSKGYSTSSVWQAYGTIYTPIGTMDEVSAIWAQDADQGKDLTAIVPLANISGSYGLCGEIPNYAGPACDINVTIATVATTFTINILPGGAFDNASFSKAASQADAGTNVTIIKWYDQTGKGNHMVPVAGKPQPFIVWDMSMAAYVIDGGPAFNGAVRTLGIPSGVVLAGNTYGIYAYGRAVGTCDNSLGFLNCFGDNTGSAGNGTQFTSVALDATGRFYVNQGFAKLFGTQIILADSTPHAVVISRSSTSTILSVNEDINTHVSTSDGNTYTGGFLFCYNKDAPDYHASHRLMSFNVFNITLTAAQQTSLRKRAYIKYDIRPQVLQQIFDIGDSRTSGSKPTNSPLTTISMETADLVAKEYRCYGFGNSGYTAAQITSGANSQLANAIATYRPKVANIYFILGGAVNSLSGGLDVPTTLSQLQTQAAMLKATGGKVVVLNELSTTSTTNGVNTKLPQIRDLISAAGPSGMGADAIMDLGKITAFLTPSTTAFFPDGLHPSYAMDQAWARSKIPYLLSYAATVTQIPGIRVNRNYRPPLPTSLSLSIAYDPPSLIAASQTSTTFTVKGATLGDMADVSFSLDVALLNFRCYVSSADTVTLVIRNDTAGIIDLAPGVLNIRVRK